MPIPYDKNHVVHHASEIPMLEDEGEVYTPPEPPKPVRYTKFEVWLSKQFYRLACLIVK